MVSRRNLVELLVDSEVKAELLSIFHKTPGITDTLEGFAERIGCTPQDAGQDIDEFVKTGLLKETKLYTHNIEKDLEIQETLISQLESEQTLDLTPETNNVGKTGIELVDEQIVDPFPWDVSILLLSDPSAESRTLCQQFASTALGEERIVCFVVTDDFPRRLRSSMSNMGVDTGTLEKQGKLVFLDCHSSKISAETDAKYVEDPRNMTSLSITISKILHEVGPDLVVLDSLTGLIQNAGMKSSIEFLKSFTSKIINAESRSVASLNRGAFHPVILSGLIDMADLVIEMRAQDNEKSFPEGISLQMRIIKGRGIRFSTGWIGYTVDPTRGLVRGEPLFERYA